jgi:hypothetical protein
MKTKQLRFDMNMDFDKVLERLRAKWWMPEWGFIRKGGRVELHTGGWSGNEALIHKLQRSLFWSMCWEKSVRGGHYYFRIPKGWRKNGRNAIL